MLCGLRNQSSRFSYAGQVSPTLRTELRERVGSYCLLVLDGGRHGCGRPGELGAGEEMGEWRILNRGKRKKCVGENYVTIPFKKKGAEAVNAKYGRRGQRFGSPPPLPLSLKACILFLRICLSFAAVELICYFCLFALLFFSFLLFLVKKRRPKLC